LVSKTIQVQNQGHQKLGYLSFKKNTYIYIYIDKEGLKPDCCNKMSPIQRRRSLVWYCVKSMVVLLVIVVTMVYLSNPKTRNSYQTSFTQKNDNDPMGYTILDEKQLLHGNLTLNTVQQKPPFKPEVDDDGNALICHRIAYYRLSKCEFAKKYCPYPLSGGLINYLKVRYCFFERAPPVFFVLAAGWVLILFYLLSDTAEKYLCPSLTEISRYLRLSPNVAGVTFMALGNGASDIASIIAGVFSGSTGFAIGEPIGAGLFVTTCVMAAVILFSDTKVDGLPFLRDIIVYFMSVVFVFIVYMTKEFQLWQALVCLGVYCFYVLVVIIMRILQVWRRMRELKKEQKAAQIANLKEQEIYAKWIKKPVVLHLVGHPTYENNEESKHLDHIKIQRTEIDEHELEMINSIQILDIETDGIDDEDTDENVEAVKKRWGSLRVQPIHGKERFNFVLKHHSSAFFFPKGGVLYNKIPGEFDNNRVDDLESNVNDEDNHLFAYITEDYFVPNSPRVTKIEEEQPEESSRNYFIRFLKWIEWDKSSWFDRILFVIVFPTIIIRNLTIPQADPERWSKFFAVICPIFIGPFILLAVNSLEYKLGGVFPLWILLMLIGACIGILIAFTSSWSQPPRKYHFLFVFSGFACSVIWIYMVANELVDVLQSCGIMWEISNGILALTVLAWGNSVGDLVADVAVARSGFPAMAVGAVYGGPCLNLLIGVGLSMTAQCISYGTFPLIADSNVTMSFLFLLASLLSAVLVLTLNKFHAPKIFGIFLLLIYIIFMVMSVLVEVGLIFQ
jgi:sodium/potassium/calcium exchanger 6